MSGRTTSRQRSASAPPDRSSSAISAPCSRWTATMRSSSWWSWHALGRDELEADAAGAGAGALDGRPGLAHGGVDVEDGAGVEVDEQHLALGQQRETDVERRRAGAHVEGEEGVVGLGGRDELAAADLGGAEHAAHERLAADHAARRAGRRSAGSGGPSGPSRGTRGTSRSARGRGRPAASRGSGWFSPSRRANSASRSPIESASSSVRRRSDQPGPESTRPSSVTSPGRVGRAQVRDLEEDGRAPREQAHAVRRGCGVGGVTRPASADRASGLSPDRTGSDLVDGALAGELDVARRTRGPPRRAPRPRRARRRCG